jgi:hypothetical protein
MLHASTQLLVEKLCELSEAGQIDWRPAGPGVLTFDTEGYRIEAALSPPELRILASDGRLIETATAADLASAPAPAPWGDLARRLASLGAPRTKPRLIFGAIPSFAVARR